jgi:hypothetical protein
VQVADDATRYEVVIQEYGIMEVVTFNLKWRVSIPYDHRFPYGTCMIRFEYRPTHTNRTGDGLPIDREGRDSKRCKLRSTLRNVISRVRRGSTNWFD